MSDRRRVVIDCDTGVDDALALLLCLKHLDVLGITTVGGNVGLDYVQRNTRYVLQTAGRADVPVFAGYAKPMLVPLQDASHVHGKGGLGMIEVSEPVKPLEKRHAVDFIIDTFLMQEDVFMITIGPMTNLAQALLREPKLKQRIPEILCMGGSMTYGNITPAAEFNIFVDPEAAKIVFDSGIPIKMVGLNLCRQQVVTGRTAEEIRGFGNSVSELAYRLLQSRVGRSDMDHLCDACCVMWYCAKGVITKSAMMHVAVETKGEYTRGMTLCDTRPFYTAVPAEDYSHTPRTEPITDATVPNVEVALEMDQARFTQVLLDTLRAYS